MLRLTRILRVSMPVNKAVSPVGVVLVALGLIALGCERNEPLYPGDGFAITPDSGVIAVSQQLRFTLIPTVGSSIPKVIWRSSAPNIATVDSLGVATGVAGGRTGVDAILASDTMTRARAILIVH